MSLTLRLALAAALIVPATSFADHHEGGGEEAMPGDEGAGENPTDPVGSDMGGDAAGGDAAGGDAATDGGGGGAAHGMVLGQGKIAVNLGLIINLSKDNSFDPVTINPDIVYGVMPKLDAGLYHTPMGLTGFWDVPGVFTPGSGVCIGDNCDKAFNGPTGLLANYSLAEGQLSLAGNGGFVFNTFDPFALALKLGVNGRYMMDKLAIVFSPNIYLGLTEREGDPLAGTLGNKEVLNIPVSLGYMLSPQLHLGVQTGIRGPLDNFGDFYTVPLAVGGMFAINESLSVAGSFSFSGLINAIDGLEAADLRVLSLYAMWHN